MPKWWSVGIWLSWLLTCCGCHGRSTRAEAHPLTTIYLSENANAAMWTWIHAGSDRWAGNIANTGSMKPTLDEHYVVIVEKRPFARLHAGDIALINASSTPGARVAHRLVDQLPMGWWITCGDANRQADPLMSERNYANAVVIAAIEKHTGAVKIFDRGARMLSAIAKTPDALSGGSFKSHIVCSKER